MLESPSVGGIGKQPGGFTQRGMGTAQNAIRNSTPNKGRLTNYTDYNSLMYNRSAVAGKARAIDAATAPKNPGLASRQFSNTPTLTRVQGPGLMGPGSVRGSVFGSYKPMQQLQGPTLNGPGMTAEFKPLFTGKSVVMGPVTSIFDKIG